MPSDVKPLFRPEALRSPLAAFTLPPETVAARVKIAEWAKRLGTGSLDKKKETELLPAFVHDVFEAALGYTRPPAHPYSLKRESLVEVDGKFADAGFGRFNGGESRYVAVLEGKGPKDPLDLPFAGRRVAANVQAMLYAVQLKVDWYLVTNIKEIRLYHKGHDTATYERFETAKLAEDDDAYRRFIFLLGAERVVVPEKNHLDELLAESKVIGRQLTTDYYREYRDLRRKMFDAIRESNPGKDPRALLAASQKILDRVLFIAFCEDRDLLPRDSIAGAYRHKDPYNPRPVWENFKGLFRSVDNGNPTLNIDAYNGGLYEQDDFVESLIVPDSVCEGFKKLADYEYGLMYTSAAKQIDVEILGHIFEQSISDLEELHEEIGGHAKTGPSKRKREGAFYTPDFITRYIVAETLGPVLKERFEKLRVEFENAVPKKGEGARARSALKDPRVFDRKKLNESQQKSLLRFWNAWIAELETIRIVDPSCGSGAFLIEAFDQMFAAYREAQGFQSELTGGPSLLDVQRTILTRNLFGMDLNAEAVSVARLSCWIKTAERGKKLTALDKNIRRGNSVIADPSPLESWRAEFPRPFEDGGFDVVIGNPPYVRQEWFSEDKYRLEKWYESFDSTADLFVYFYELGVKLLRPGGRLGYITSGSWVRGNFGSKLREFLAKNAALESLVDFGEYQPFSDAEMIRPTVAVMAKRPPGDSMRLFKWLTAGKPPENLSEVIRSAPLMRTDHLGSGAWELESDDVIALRQKLAASGTRLVEFVKGDLHRGVTTGADEVFVIDTATRKALIEADKNSEQLIKPFLKGTHLRPWYTEESGEYLIFTRRGTCIREYPAIEGYLSTFKSELAPKPGDWAPVKPWKGRKGGSYRWFEIQDTVDYWLAFEKGKIVWPDIGNHPRFSMDFKKQFVGNSGYVIPREDYFLLGVLSSWATWFYLSKTAQPLRLRSDRWQYRLIAQFVENVPIPVPPSSADREAVAELAKRCGQIAGERYALERAVQSRITQTFGVDTKGNQLGKLNEKAQEWWLQPLNQLGAALKQSFKLPRSPFTAPAIADEWEPYLLKKKAEVERLASRLAEAEAEINDRVYRLFNLTPDEIKLLQREVEH